MRTDQWQLIAEGRFFFFFKIFFKGIRVEVLKGG